MYTQQDRKDVALALKKRWFIAAVPAVLVFAAAVAIFVYGQLNRNDQLWMLTAFLTIVSGGYFLFAYGVYVRPAALYRRHLGYMLQGRMRETTGVLKFFSEDVTDHEGLDCYAMLVNVGQKNDPKDDRLFYYDAYKARPAFELGERITVISNDKMVANIQGA